LLLSLRTQYQENEEEFDMGEDDIDFWYEQPTQGQFGVASDFSNAGQVNGFGQLPRSPYELPANPGGPRSSVPGQQGSILEHWNRAPATMSDEDLGQLFGLPAQAGPLGQDLGHLLQAEQ
jgi:hypothetical protein